MNPKDFYEAMYAQHRETPPGSSAHLWEKLEINREEAAFQLLDGGERFLDVGCGEGGLVFLAALKFNEAYGIDISTPRIQRAQERAQQSAKLKVYFQAADVGQGVPFDDAYFDAASCVVTLEFLFNPAGLLRELYRVLKPRGVLIVVVANVAYLPRRISALLGRAPKTSSAAGFMDGGTLHYFTLSSLISLLQQEGFSIAKKSTAGKLWFLRNWWKSLLASGLVIKAIKADKARNQSKLTSEH